MYGTDIELETKQYTLGATCKKWSLVHKSRTINYIDSKVSFIFHLQEQTDNNKGG